MNPEDIVEYSMHVYLKSGKVVASDPVEARWRVAESSINEISNNFSEASMALSFIRNECFILIPKDAVDYIEFHVDVPDARL